MNVWPARRPEAQTDTGWHVWRRPWLRAFWNRAYKENITGLAGMVAYNLMLAVFPFALLVLFIFGQVVNSSDIELSVVRDIQRLFPNIEQDTLQHAIDRVRASSTTIGIAAAVGGVWIGASFWGAMDTAFCRIYHCECRGWLRQKRFALVMLVVALLFMAATVAVPTLQSILVSGAAELPLGLSDVNGVVFGLSLVAGLTLIFLILCVIYWRVPSASVPWLAVWPGALAATAAIGIVDYAFPAYLSNVSTIAQFGTTLVFVLIVLLWFYALAIIILGGAVINAIRFEDLALRGRLGQPPSAVSVPASPPA
jgi:YihY family inner membrane protein